MIFSNYVLKLFKLNIIFLEKKKYRSFVSPEIEFDEYYLLNCISSLMLKKRNVSCTQKNCKYRKYTMARRIGKQFARHVFHS